MTATSAPTSAYTVRCDFVGLDAESELTIVSAVVDQMCGHADVDALLLDSIEIPLVEVFDVIAQRRIVCQSAVVALTTTAEGPRLAVELFGQAFDGDDPDAMFGRALPLIASFFDEAVRIGHGVLELRGLLT